MNARPKTTGSDPHTLLAARRPLWRRWLLPGVVLLVLALAGFYFSRSGQQAAAPAYQTEEVVLGSLTVSVSATGNLEPTNQVDVGSELSGIIDTVLVDDNDQVKKGQVLARLDTAKLRDAITKSRASLADAEAQVKQASATAREAQANLDRLREVERLSGGKVPARTELEKAEAALDRARADETRARATVAQARAALSSDETNLSKASIRSPIDGVVLTRKVEPGQTVAASLQAPVLFTLAEDLARMELPVDVDEADVGQVKEGQSASFGVDAWPQRKYPAQVVRVGYGSTVKEGVVTYPAVLRVDNDDLSLRPGMTATAEIITQKRDNVLLIPNAALRFTPETQPRDSGGGLVGSLMPRMPRAPKKAGVNGKGGGPRQVWILKDGQPQVVSITVGASDGRQTEVTGGDLKAGMQVITESLTGTGK